MKFNSAQANIRPLAIADLEEIVRYLDARSADAGDRFLDSFLHATEFLGQLPRAGRLRVVRGRLKGLRSWPLSEFGPYIIFYMPGEVGIDIVRVLHGARDVDRELRR